MELEEAKKIAERIVSKLEPVCERVEIAGSIRRQKPEVNDIDLVVLPKEPVIHWGVDDILMQLGTYKMAGLKIARIEMDSLPLDVYFATPDTFATLLLIRTGSEEHNIRLAGLAKAMGWHLKASGEGLLNEYQERIAGDTEESIFTALGLRYLEPWERG